MQRPRKGQPRVIPIRSLPGRLLQLYVVCSLPGSTRMEDTCGFQRTGSKPNCNFRNLEVKKTSEAGRGELARAHIESHRESRREKGVGRPKRRRRHVRSCLRRDRSRCRRWRLSEPGGKGGRPRTTHTRKTTPTTEPEGKTGEETLLHDVRLPR